MGIYELKKIRTFALMVKESAGYAERMLDHRIEVIRFLSVLKVGFTAGKSVSRAAWFHCSIFGLPSILCDSD
jgi:hypothetical protein